MAAPSFPTRRPQGQGGTANYAQPGGSASQIDAPPPSPVMAQAPQGADPQAGFPSFSEMARPQTAGTPGQATSPEILVGIMSSMQTISGMYDSMASILPDLAGDFALLKDLGERTMAKLLVKGGQPASPNNAGLSFPGGGFDRGAQ